jgi:two-component system response regulator AtoC
MALTLQAKLLSLLDTQHFRRVGAVQPTAVDIRFIAATNKVLLSEVTAGKFREDLYYRLQVVAVNLPPLRDRGDDVLILTQHFIDRYNTVYKRSIRGLSDETADIFRRYKWPGNVRELENLLERIFILEDDNVIQPRHLPDRILRTTVGRGNAEATPSPAGETVAGFHEATAEFQRKLLQQALAEANGSLQDAAVKLKMSRHALRHQMLKLGMQ